MGGTPPGRGMGDAKAGGRCIVTTVVGLNGDAGTAKESEWTRRLRGRGEGGDREEDGMEAAEQPVVGEEGGTSPRDWHKGRGRHTRRRRWWRPGRSLLEIAAAGAPGSQRQKLYYNVEEIEAKYKLLSSQAFRIGLRCRGTNTEARALRSTRGGVLPEKHMKPTSAAWPSS